MRARGSARRRADRVKQEAVDTTCGTFYQQESNRIQIHLAAQEMLFCRVYEEQARPPIGLHCSDPKVETNQVGGGVRGCEKPLGTELGKPVDGSNVWVRDDLQVFLASGLWW